MVGRYRGVFLYIVALPWLPQSNVLGRNSDNVPFSIDYAGSCTAGANIYSNIVLHLEPPVDCARIDIQKFHVSKWPIVR